MGNPKEDWAAWIAEANTPRQCEQVLKGVRTELLKEILALASNWGTGTPMIAAEDIEAKFELHAVLTCGEHDQS